jgi:hypothetical protein
VLTGLDPKPESGRSGPPRLLPKKENHPTRTEQSTTSLERYQAFAEWRCATVGHEKQPAQPPGLRLIKG